MKIIITICLLFFTFSLSGFFLIKEIDNFFILSAHAESKSPYKNYSVIIGEDEILGRYETLHYEFNN